MADLTVLRILEDLTDEELRTFGFHLQALPGLPSRLPRGKLEGASRVQLAQLLLQHYPGTELAVVARVLGQVPRRDLLQKYHLLGQEATPRAEAAAPAGPHLQLPVSEKTREVTPRTNSLMETAPGQRRISDQDLMKLAKNLGKNWKAIGIEYLKVAVSSLEQIEEDNPGNAVMRNFYMLNFWKNREGQMATPHQLYHILAQEDVPLDQDAIEFLRNT